MVLFSTSDLQDLSDLVDEFTEDPSINTTIRYRQYTGEDYYNPENQMYDEAIYTSWSGVSTLMTDVVVMEVERIGELQVGDTKFVINRSSVSGVLSTKDIVIESGVSYNVLKLREDPIGLTAIIFGRKLNEA